MVYDAIVVAMVPKEVKEKALAALGGISLSDAITFYLKKVVKADGIPFDLNEETIDTRNVPFVKMDEDGYFVEPAEWRDEDDDYEPGEDSEGSPRTGEICPECGSEMVEATENRELYGIELDGVQHCKCPRCGKTKLNLRQLLALIDLMAAKGIPND